MKERIFLVMCCLMLRFQLTLAQDRPDNDNTAVTFEEIYDEPYSVNKLFVGFQPLYGELFATNVNAGFGVEARYYLKDKVDFKAHFRKTYSSSFYDFSRELAKENSNVDNKAEIYNYYEFGGTYHIKDFESTSKTKMVLYKSAYKGDSWAARVPLRAEVPCKLRKIYGGRLGAIIWNSTTDISRALDRQGLTNADLVNSENIGLPVTYIDPITSKSRDFKVFSNIYSTGLYIGGSMTWIRNIAVSFDKYEEGVDDGIMTLFFDILYSPGLKVDDILYNNDIYSVSALKKSPVGLRLGIDGKFNRQLSWAYGGEIGYRPSIQGQGVFAMFKISFPIYGTNLEYKVESFGK
ncbi:MAG: hypothetical protein AABY93_16410 [Bacteroidota bacterium]